MTRALPRRKRVAFAAVAVLLSLVVTLALIAVVDVALRARYASSVGLNRWGYRGAVVGARRAGEPRVVVVGGSTVFGFGVATAETFPTFLERRLRARGTPATVVNLGYPKESAWSFAPTLDDYAYLGYDLAVLYEGYNDLRRPNTRTFRRDSPVFRATGYLPFLPLVLSEKARALRYGGDLGERFGREDPVFRPGLAGRATSGALQAAAEVARGLEQVLGPLTTDGGPRDGAATAGGACLEPYRHYCDGVRAGVERALAQGARVLVVTQPYISDTHVTQQRQMAAMLRERFGGDPHVAHANLGTAIDLRDRSIAWDGMHLTPSGNDRLASLLTTPILDLLARK